MGATLGLGEVVEGELAAGGGDGRGAVQAADAVPEVLRGRMVDVFRAGGPQHQQRLREETD